MRYGHPGVRHRIAPTYMAETMSDESIADSHPVTTGTSHESMVGWEMADGASLEAQPMDCTTSRYYHFVGGEGGEGT